MTVKEQIQDLLNIIEELYKYEDNQEVQVITELDGSTTYFVGTIEEYNRECMN